jgi:tetratricopeptide (TPR) repeat protein
MMKKIILSLKSIFGKLSASNNRKKALALCVVVSVLVLAAVLNFYSNKKFDQEKDRDLQTAFIEIENGNPEEAIKILEARHSRDKSDRETARRLAEYYFRGKKYAEFEDMVFNYDFQDGQIFTMRAYIARSNGEQEKALEYYKEAIKLQPGYSSYYVNLANYYQILNQAGLALETIKDGLNYHPKSSTLNLFASNCALELGDKALAKIYAQKVLEFDSKNNRAQEITSMR